MSATEKDQMLWTIWIISVEKKEEGGLAKKRKKRRFNSYLSTEIIKITLLSVFILLI